MERSNQSNGQSSLYLDVTNQIVELLESQKLTWDKPWITLSKDGKRPHNALSGRCYSGLNQILLSIRQMRSKYPYSGWLTFKQIQDEGGRVLVGNIRGAEDAARFIHTCSNPTVENEAIKD